MYTNRALQIHHEIPKVRLVHSVQRSVKAALVKADMAKAAFVKAVLVKARW